MTRRPIWRSMIGAGLVAAVLVLVPAPAGAQTGEAPARPVGTDFAASSRQHRDGPVTGAADDGAAAAAPDASVEAAADPLCTAPSYSDPDEGRLVDVRSYEVRYDCTESSWVMNVQTWRPYPPNELAGLVLNVDTDGDVYGNGCEWGDYAVVAQYEGEFYAYVLRTPSCEESSWTYMGDAYVSASATGIVVTFMPAQVGSATTLRFSGYISSIGLYTTVDDLFPDTEYHAVSRPALPSPPAPITPEAGGARLAESHSIFRLYSSYLLRQPDDPGLAYWEDQYLTCGRSLAQVSDFFAGSPEFLDRYGQVNDAEFVELVYRNVLGRAPEDAGFAYWVDQLFSGDMSRGEVMVGFSQSPEYVRRTGTAPPDVPLCTPRSISDSVYRLYRAYFLREPETAGERYWTFRYSRCDATITAVSDYFATSPEFQARYGSLSNRQFVELVYQNVLGRPGEVDGVDYWNAALGIGGMTRGEVMIGFSESPEHVSRTGTRAPSYPAC